MTQTMAIASRQAQGNTGALRRARGRLAAIAVTAGIGLYLVWVIVPLLWLALMSIKTGDQQFHRPPLFLFHPTAVNYLSIFSSGYQAATGTSGLDLSHLLLNSVLAGVLSTALTIALAIPGGYVMARFRLRVNSWVLGFMLFTRMLPPMSLALPLFLISRQIHLYDNLLLLILVYSAINLPFNQYLLLGFFGAVPMEIEEAGLLDGLTRFGCLWRLVLPLMLPGLAATAILTLWVTWTDYQLALILTSNVATTMPVGIAELVSQDGQLWGVFGAAGITYSVPVVAFCLFAQRYLVSGLTMGSIK